MKIFSAERYTAATMNGLECGFGFRQSGKNWDDFKIKLAEFPNSHLGRYEAIDDLIDSFRDTANKIAKALSQDADQDAIAAAKYRALRDSARLTCMGSAGVWEPMDNGYAHATFNFWTKMPKDYQDDEQAIGGRAAFEKYIEIALKVMQ